MAHYISSDPSTVMAVRAAALEAYNEALYAGLPDGEGFGDPPDAEARYARAQRARSAALALGAAHPRFATHYRHLLAGPGETVRTDGWTVWTTSTRRPVEGSLGTTYGPVQEILGPAYKYGTGVGDAPRIGWWCEAAKLRLVGRHDPQTAARLLLMGVTAA